MKTLKLTSILIIILLTCVRMAWCETEDNEEKVYAVQNRIFHRSHELTLYGGYISGDDFYKVFPFGVGYTYHHNELFSWEVLRVQYMFNVERDLKNDLETNFGVTPENFPEPTYMYHTHLVMKPLYGKSAVLNQNVVNHEIYLFAGPGMLHSERKYSTGETKTENDFSLSFGLGLRYFLSDAFSLNFEIRDLLNFKEDDTQNSLCFSFGLGYRFDMAPRKKQRDPTTTQLKKILGGE